MKTKRVITPKQTAAKPTAIVASQQSTIVEIIDRGERAIQEGRVLSHEMPKNTCHDG